MKKLIVIAMFAVVFALVMSNTFAKQPVQDTRFYYTGQHEQLRMQTEDYHVFVVADRVTRNKYMIVQINGAMNSTCITPLLDKDGKPEKVD